MMVPGIDMFRLFILRLYNKKNPFSPDREHVHHLLLNKFSNLKTLLILNYCDTISNYFAFYELLKTFNYFNLYISVHCTYILFKKI